MTAVPGTENHDDSGSLLRGGKCRVGPAFPDSKKNPNGNLLEKGIMLRKSRWCGSSASAVQALQSPGWRQQVHYQCCLVCLWGLYVQRTGSLGTGSWTLGTSVWGLVLVKRTVAETDQKE